MAKNINAWTVDLYGETALGCTRAVGEFIRDIKSHELEVAMAQIPGQTRIDVADNGDVEIVDEEG